MTEWKKYTGSAEQVDEMRNAKHGVIIKHHDGEICPAIFTEETELLDHFDDRSKYQPSEYLICNPHPLADMICQQARTGQPVHVMEPSYDISTLSHTTEIYVTETPNWGIPGAHYSFTAFED